MQVTDDMIEKAARAMCIQGGFDPDELMPNDGPRWRYYVAGARAALTVAYPTYDQHIERKNNDGEVIDAPATRDISGTVGVEAHASDGRADNNRVHKPSHGTGGGRKDQPLTALSDKQAGEVKIKPLEWSSEPPYRVARPFTGVHYATEVVWPENGAGFDYVLLSGPTIGTKRFAALSDAQAAAQADYEQRIRSALVDVPAVEPVAWQPRYKQDVIDHHRSIGGDLWEYAMTVYPTKAQAEGYGYGGHEARPLYTSPPLSHREGEDSAEVIEKEIARVVQSVNEWDDRTSPDEYPEHLLITSEELADILRNFSAALAATRSASATTASGTSAIRQRGESE